MTISTIYDRVRFLSTTLGTSDFSVGLAPTGFRTPAGANVPNGTTISYTAESTDKTQWESGQGTYSSAGPTIVRTTILESSSSGAKVNFTNVPTVWLDALAQDILSGANGFAINVTDPTVSADLNNQYAAVITHNTHGIVSNPNFSTESALQINQNILAGQNVNGGATTAKKTHSALQIVTNATGAGQNFCTNWVMNGWANSDTFIGSEVVNYTSGPISGDEGKGFRAVSTCNQLSNLVNQSTISAVSRSGLNTTASQGITASQNVQTVSVASTAGASVNDWVCVGQEVFSGSPNMEVVQITAIGSGTISGVFTSNHSNGVTITPALVLTLSGTYQMGEGRILVDLSGATYSTGTVSSITPNSNIFNGSGTTWTAGMVGGTSPNFGVISLDSDTYSGAPFNGSGAQGPLRSWYQIRGINSTTALTISSMTVAGNQDYHGQGVGTTHTYMIRPGAQVMRIISSIVVCETSTHTWTVGDTVECVICPFPDVSGFQYQMALWTPGGAACRRFMDIANIGARTIQAGFSCTNSMPGGSNSDADAFTYAFMSDKATNGIYLSNCSNAAVNININSGNTGSRVLWNGNNTWITSNQTGGNFGMDLQLSGSGRGGVMQVTSGNIVSSGQLPALVWQGSMGPWADTFAHYATASGTYNGQIAYVTDSTTTTIGATVTGGGANHVFMGLINGTWKVLAA